MDANKNIENPHNFTGLVDNIIQTHETFKKYAYKAINISITVRNWMIGYYIVEYEQQGNDRGKYGEKLLENISNKLHEKGLTNVSAAELSRFRQFYSVYPQIIGTLSRQSLQLPKSILETLSQESLQLSNSNLGTPSQDLNVEKFVSVEPIKLITNLSFSHLAELIKIDNPLKRLFYEVETIKGTWGVRELRRQINSLFYERTGLSKSPQKLIEIVQTQSAKFNFEELIKSPFTFEFLGLKAKDVVYESDLEQAIMDNLQNFLLELGNGFCFEARRKKY
ncbi:hypothetical protein FACS1894201_08410 [Bacteroidia bacterium]|nr:hypothetical protein FACS1894201_08410 [Bacteroidia bacterium]